MFNIIKNTFKEIVRNKFLYLILFFAFIFIIFSILLWKLTIWEDNKIIVDFWLAMIEIFWIIWVLFVGSQLLFKEVEWKTIFLILSKPIKRYEFILWKFFGFSLTIALIIALQSVLFIAVLLFKSIQIDLLIIMSLIFIFLKLEILLAMVFFFSSFMSSILTILVTIMIYFISHSFNSIVDMTNRFKNELLTNLIQVFQLLFPPFEALNIKDVIWWFTNFDFVFYISNIFYSILYLGFLLYFTVLIFNKKEFE